MALGATAQASFETQTIDGNISIGYGLAIGDVDGDGRSDILLADKKQFVWYRNGDWKRFVLVDNLTVSGNVCIAARDIDGDGKVEVAVGAQWNPGETSDTARSGAVHYLVRPADPTELWKPVRLHHEPTVHRMRWVQVGSGKFQLIVVPLHGRGNKDGNGKGVRVYAYEKPKHPESPWALTLVDSTMHLTHNLDVVAENGREVLYIGGKEGVKRFEFRSGRWHAGSPSWVVQGESFGEVRVMPGRQKQHFLAGIMPMHGSTLAVYDRNARKELLMEGLGQGHALASGMLNKGTTVQVLAGWREPDANGQVGIKLFTPPLRKGEPWSVEWVDQNGMACEDLQIADLNNDGKTDIIAAGRSTHNLRIYWNK